MVVEDGVHGGFTGSLATYIGLLGVNRDVRVRYHRYRLHMFNQSVDRYDHRYPHCYAYCQD